MSRYLPVILIASVGFALAACQTTEPAKQYTNRRDGTEYPKTSSPEPESTPSPRVETVGQTVPEVPKVEVEVAPTPIPTPVVQDYPTAVPVEGKPGFVKSQNGTGIVDVRGYPPGTEVTDPYSGKVFLVP